MEVVDQIKEAIVLLNKVDEYNETLPSLMSQNDQAISDLYHYIENNTMNSKSCYRMIKELKERLIERRNLKNEQNIIRVFNKQKLKLSEINNRKMILVDLNREVKSLKEPYKNRVYDEKELKEKLEG